MIDAIVGGVIMVVATTSLFLAYEVAEKAMNSAGRYCLTGDEEKVLRQARLSDSEFKDFWIYNLRNANTYLKDGIPAKGKVPAAQCLNNE